MAISEWYRELQAQIDAEMVVSAAVTAIVAVVISRVFRNNG